MVLGIGAGALSLPAGTFVRALVAFGLVVVLARAAGGGTGLPQAKLAILVGVAGTQLFNALTSFVIAQPASAEQVRGVNCWLMGGISAVRWPDVRLAVQVSARRVAVC